MRETTRLLTAFALSATAAATGDAADIGALRLYETPAYSLVVADGVSASGIARQIANFERVLSRTLVRDVRPTGTATHIYVVGGAAWERYLRPGRAIDAEFVPRRFANLLLIDADLSREKRREAVFHEYTHLFLHTQFRVLHPLWFDEGLATTYAEFADLYRAGLDSLEIVKFMLRIEEIDADRTFSVGILYGPSGSGKSSMLRAGLLPRLSERVLAVFVEASAENLELSVRRALDKDMELLCNGIDVHSRDPFRG